VRQEKETDRQSKTNYSRERGKGGEGRRRGRKKQRQTFAFQPFRRILPGNINEDPCIDHS